MPVEGREAVSVNDPSPRVIWVLSRLFEVPVLSVPGLVGSGVLGRVDVDQPIAYQLWLWCIEDAEANNVLCHKVHDLAESVDSRWKRDRGQVGVDVDIHLRVHVARAVLPVELVLRNGRL